MQQVHKRKDRRGSKMFEIGRICTKIAGRDSNRKCVVVDIVDDNHVLIDGQTRRRKCNVAHLEPSEMVLKLKKGAANRDVAEALRKEGIDCEEKKPKPAKPEKT